MTHLLAIVLGFWIGYRYHIHVVRKCAVARAKRFAAERAVWELDRRLFMVGQHETFKGREELHVHG